MRIPAAAAPLLAATFFMQGCGGLQHAYDDAARRECRKLVNAAEVDACLARVSENSREKSAERRD